MQCPPGGRAETKKVFPYLFTEETLWGKPMPHVFI